MLAGTLSVIPILPSLGDGDITGDSVLYPVVPRSDTVI